MRTGFTIACLAVLLLVGAVPAALAQEAPATPDLISLRDGVFSDAQADRGAAVFEQACLRCHQPEQFTGPGFMGAWSGQTVDALFELIRTRMPEDNPSSLKKREYAALLAYLFRLNGVPVGEADLPSTTRKLKLIRIEAPLATEQKP